MGDLTPVLVLMVIFGGIGMILRIVKESSLRQRLLEKGPVDDQTRQLLTRGYGSSNLANIKWGMVLVAIGAAALISQMPWFDFNDGGALGLMLVFAGIAFLIYYPIAQKYERDQNGPTQNRP